MVAAALSGGVDSTVAAALCLDAGYSLIGVTMRLASVGENGLGVGGEAELAAAAKAALELAIPLRVVDLSPEFDRRVLRYAWDEYARGRTPNPCVVCNHFIKFGALLSAARGLGAGIIATGHHARIIRGDGRGTHVARGADPAKDQSYFLSRLTPEQIDSAWFPIGGMTKDEVRVKAAEHGFSCLNHPESQDVCFSNGKGNYAEILRKMYGGGTRSGDFIEADSGRVLGTHNGLHHYTIGQRKGLGLALGKPAYVCGIDAEKNAVWISTDEADLLSSDMMVADFNWQMAGFAESAEFDCEVQIRHRHRAAPAKVIPTAGGKIKIVFDQPQKSVTPGQAAALYDGDHVIGGGWIESVGA